MKLISNSHSVDWDVANLLLNYVVNVTTRGGDMFDMLVERVEPDGFVTLHGPRVTFNDEFDLPEDAMVRHETREVTLIDIDQLEVF